MSDAFHDFEHAGWQRAAAAYPDAFGGMTSQATEPLLEAAAAGPEIDLLDVASGPGYVAAAAAARGARVIGVDFSRAMVEEARRRAPSVDFREGDAEALPFDAESFDAVVMSFGLLHLGQPEQALREMRRVLRVGGRAAFTVWAPAERTVAFRIVLDAIEKHGGVASPAPPGPPFFRFSDHAECTRVLLEAGFASPSVVEVPMTWVLPSSAALFEAMTGASVRTGALLNAQPAAARATIRDAVIAATEPFQRDGRVELPMPCVLASAIAR